MTEYWFILDFFEQNINLLWRTPWSCKNKNTENRKNTFVSEQDNDVT